MNTPIIEVGIATRPVVEFAFSAPYSEELSHSTRQGEQRATWKEGKILFDGNRYDTLLFEPTADGATFLLKGVTIGVNFHWQRNEDQRFYGALKLLATAEGIVVINRIDVERYLECVVSSEMNAAAPAEFLKAHAVISRSWLLAQIEKKQNAPQQQAVGGYEADGERIRWYDRTDHTLFDVCADDHCQRYQGIGRTAERPELVQLVAATRGEVMTAGGALCDTRFSKCCGGVTEAFEHCWEPRHYSYLTPVRDSEETTVPNLSTEEQAAAWIASEPAAFCHTTDHALLATILNNYDQETTDFYRWEVHYAQTELAELIRRKSGLTFGGIIDLVPLQRGASGRIERLKIVGTKLTYIIGKELEIRRTLSESHLYSSAFTVEKVYDDGGNLPTAFLLRGAGWGHGVGLCQIGAAVMSTKGYRYDEILAHYFPGASLEKRY